MVHAKLTGPVLAGFEDKLALAPLFVPGMTRDQLKGVMGGNAGLRDLVMELAALVTLWKDTPNSAIGELFFEIDEDNAYTLYPV